MNTLQKIDQLKENLSQRIFYQIKFATLLNEENQLQLDGTIKEALSFLTNTLDKKGCITHEDAYVFESILAPFEKPVKEYTILCAAHAHIDMNWMWGLDETVAVTLQTFRTVLNLMEEYPTFCYSQSQASVYQIVEEYQPEMLKEIKKRVHEGRWELAASHWVEADKNMSSEQSQIRHLTYTKSYLSQLFDVDPSSLDLDYEPDTFGHHQNVPEILGSSGVKYYYHCRGYDGHVLYNWKAPSGQSILVYKEPQWYNSKITPDMALHLPKFCKEQQLDVMLKVYGCGDHGGGPTRKDIEKILSMNEWPIFPNIKMSTYKAFFEKAQQKKAQYPVVKGEQNFIFTGCYTSQSRIKMGNKHSQAHLYDCEASGILSLLSTNINPIQDAKKGWIPVLFNHFHDILPGSGVIETREHAMGKYQEVAAFTYSQTHRSYQNIISNIDTSSLKPQTCDRNTTSEGAGVGFRTSDDRITAVERGQGIKRLYHVFSTLAFSLKQVIELTVWDWEGDPQRLVIKNANGDVLEHQFLPSTKSDSFDSRYWQHKYFKVLVEVSIEALGYTTLILDEKETPTQPPFYPSVVRVEREHVYEMENQHIKALFDPTDLSLQTLIDKKTDRSMIKSSGFRGIMEDPSKGMTSWIIGKYMSVEKFSNVKLIKKQLEKNALRQWMEYTACWKDSTITVVVSLDKNAKKLDYDVQCEWLEKGIKKQSVPMMDFHIDCDYSVPSYGYDIPFGYIERKPMFMDVPTLNGCMAENADQPAIAIISKDRNGFRGNENAISLRLLRSSYDPDPHPELGNHKMHFGIHVIDQSDTATFLHNIKRDIHPLQSVSGQFQKGLLPLEKTFVKIKEDHVMLSSVKSAMSPDLDMVLDAYEVLGKNQPVTLCVGTHVKKAFLTDVYENIIEELTITDGCVKIEPKAFGTFTLAFVL